ncbi:hypothetical protein EON65_09415 [archaeon]|nr:MAG: hypothetical protein EON65_09415 [archaeon]
MATLFDAKMLVEGLRRNMQPLDSALFGTLANHFLMHCCLDYSSVDGTGIGPYITESLIDAVNDTTSNVSDFATAHCRYAMIVDPTDCEAAIDLVFALNILDAANTKVVSVSDFPDDSTPTKHTAVLGQIKRAIEAGVCLLLKNSSLLQSALYDVINRHYVVSIKEDPSNPGHMIKEAHANIALGSFSRYVKVNPNFRLIVHVPASQLGSTPLPFLNRLEKYPLSIRSALDKRVAEIALYPPSCLRILNSKERCVSFFRAVQMGAEDFVQKLGGASSFYGFALDEVIPAWILRSIAPEALDCQLYFNHEPSLMAIVLGVYRQKHETPVSKVESVVEDNPIDNLTNILDGGIALQLKTVIRQVNFQLLNSARLDVIFRLRKKLPRCYIAEYIDKQEHLTGTSLLRKLAWWSFRGCLLIATPTPLKLIAYTRTGKSHY